MRELIAARGQATTFLASEGIALTPDARNLFLDFVAGDYVEALHRLKDQAQGNYASDEYQRQFPAFIGKKKTAEAKSPFKLFEKWISEAQPAVSTVNRWRAIFTALDAKFPDANSIAEPDAREWIKSLVTEGRSAKTVRDQWFSAINLIFKWAVEQKIITANPFTSIKVTVPRHKTQVREKAFTQEEAATILRAASAIKVERSLTAGAKRWAPWLQAYSGARGGEITQLRGKTCNR